jgi:hypothetical protein
MTTHSISCAVLACVAVACGPRAVAGRVADQPYQPYTDQRYTAVGTNTDGGTVSVTSPDGNNCIDTVNGSCVAATRTGAFCDGATSGPVDVVVVGGETKATVCYPSPSDSKSPVAVSDPTMAVSVAKTANGSAITFDSSTDGKPITGPMTLSANDVSLYGNGPDKTIIDGDLVIEKNNARVRGVRVTGNLIVKFNDVSIVLCQVDGNLTSDKNNGLFASNTVFGEMAIGGSGNQIYYNKVKGAFSVGSTDVCSDNKAFTDQNANKIVEDSELGADLTCP